MPGLDLRGVIDINAAPANRATAALSRRLANLSENSRTSSATLKETSRAMEAAARAAATERNSLIKLTAAQEANNKVRRESQAVAAKTRAQAAALSSKAADASALNATKQEIAGAESVAKIEAGRLLTQERLNTEKARGAAIDKASADKSALSAGQRQLALNRSLTETIRQRGLAEDAAGRASVRSAQIASTATRDRIAQERLLLAQQRLAQEASFHATSNARSAVEGLARTSLGIATVTGAAFIGLAANSVIMEREFANVIRTSDILDKGLTKAGENRAIDKLRLQFDSLAQTLPVSYKELTEVGAAANQLGVADTNLASFTKTVSQFSATTGVSVDTASTAFGRLDSLIPDVQQNYQGLADAINKVGVNSVATDQQIINIASQISGIAASAGLGYKAIVGFSGALASVAISPYLARGLTTRLFTNITNAAADGGDSLVKFAQVAGVSADQFKAAWEGTQSQKEGVLLRLFDGIRRAGPDAVNVLKNLGVTSVLDQPALVRLANAADSTGKAGALLAQTFRDANTAAGENAKQYEVIASTLQSKLQVALNRTQILFRNLGKSNVGPLGVAIDTISNSVLRLSQNLDQPVKLLGSIELPFKTGELLGFAALALGAVAAFTLLVGVGAKVVASFIAVRDGVLAARQVLTGARGTIFAYASGAAQATAANLRLAESERVLASTRASATLSSNRVNASNSAFNNSSLLGNYVARAKSAVQLSDNRAVKGLLNLGSKGSAALKSLAGAARTAGGAITSTLFGPIGLGVTAAVSGLAALDAAMRATGTNAGDMAAAIVQATNATQILGSTKIATATDGVAALWDKNTGSIIKDTNDLKASLNNLGGGGFLNDFGAKLKNIFTPVSGGDAGFNRTTETLNKIDAGFASLAQSGNVDGAVAGVQTFFKGLTNTQIQNALAQMPGTLSLLNTELNGVGLTAGKNNKNVIALARSNDILGKSIAAARAQALAEGKVFEALSQSGQDYITNTKTAAAASIDLNAAFKSLKSPNLKDFFKAADEQFKAFVDQSKNISKIAANIGSEYVGQLSTLDPGILALAAKTKGGMDKLKGYLDRKDLLTGLRDNFGRLDSDPKLLDAFGKLPDKLQEKISESLSKGNSLPDAFRAAGQKGVDAFNSTVDGADAKIKLEADPKALNDSLANLSTKGAKDLQVKITGDAGPAITAGQDAATTISNLRAYIVTNTDTVLAVKQGESAATYIDRLKATLTVLGDNSPAVTAGASAAFQIGELQAQIQIDADPSRATYTAAQTQTVINGLTAQLRINGDPAPAHIAGVNAADDIARLTARLLISADPNPAHRTAEQETATISRLKGIITILGNSAPAQRKGESARSYIDRLKGIITVDGNNASAKRAADQAAAYANGKTATIKVLADTGGAEGAIKYLTRGRTVTVTTNTVSGGAKLATGGPVRGLGTATSDSIPAMLSNGEYVVRAKQAQRFQSLLNNINYNGVAHFATGGQVTGGSARYNDTGVAQQSAYSGSERRARSLAPVVTELSAYDRHLLTNIANKVSINIEPEHIAQATSVTYSKQSRRGNG